VFHPVRLVRPKDDRGDVRILGISGGEDGFVAFFDQVGCLYDRTIKFVSFSEDEVEVEAGWRCRRGI
jgi:hypothetical protein